MAQNDSSNPALEGNQSINSSSGADTLTGGLGNDTINGARGNDIIRGDGGVQGTWHFETFDYNFSTAAGQAFNIESGVRTGSGYVSDFNVTTLTNTVRGTTGDPNDFGIVYTSTLNTTLGGTYRIDLRSDDGSTVQIFDSAGNALTFNNQTGGALDYLNNDFHQASTNRFGTVQLDPNETYTIQLRYWENAGQDILAATISGPDTGGVTQDLIDSPMIGLPPGPDYSVTGVPAGVEGNDVLSGGGGRDTIFGDGGDDTISGGGGNDVVDGGTGNDQIDGDGGRDSILGGAGNDTISGGAANDTLDGGDGNDVIDGDGGRDSMLGGAGDDTLSGGNERDTLEGGAGNDVLNGDADRDSLIGGDGDDTLDGGASDDILTGGTGDDTYVCTAGSGDDTITDFNDGNTGSDTDGTQTNNDFIDLSAYYTNLNEIRADLEDDNILNQSVGDFSDNTALGGSITFTSTAREGLTFDNTNVACFTRGTLIHTTRGCIPVEQIRPGERVQTRDSGVQEVRWAGSKSVPARDKFAPILIRQGALGNSRDLLVSPQHRMLLQGWGPELVTGETEVLAAAKMLVDGRRITRKQGGMVEYFHILFDRHEIILAEDCWSESFHPGDRAMGALSEDARHEIFALFPELRRDGLDSYGADARRTLKQHEARLCQHAA